MHILNIHFTYFDIDYSAVATKISATPDATAQWVISEVQPEIKELPETFFLIHTAPHTERFDVSPPDILLGPHRAIVPLILQTIGKYCDLAFISPY